MQDYIKRLLIVGLMALCISLLFLGGKHSQAEMLDIADLTSHWVWPAEGVITDLYGTRHGHHKGLDIAGEFKTPVHTVDKGVVTKSYYSGSYGHVVFIKHENNLETVYAHLNKRNVKEGQVVKQGDIIGLMGNTGDSSGVHLHFEVHKEKWTYGKENALDPVATLGEAAVGQPVISLAKSIDPVSMETVAKLRMADDAEIGEHTHSQKDEQIEKQDKSQIAKNVPAANDESRKHTVQNGETLWSIAAKYKTSIEAITHMNNLKNDHIAAGDILVIEAALENRYIVAAGDTLHSIAVKTKTPVQELKALNHLASDVIQPQQILITR
ncbi:peptidoglycan DD-metalloendopeptidase family protein [Mesobacillus subterraneus]|uniref:peptidoglycan DD-metalloendopeptidase family protein n=1 Tax=Mesobacillus subterraneus TaxID=285983 RepID=UPI00203F9E26|nr:peptidoglycan DD-metalloendopeptidase family protein [Mesobacillus subterraneus]MCM3665332.1 peptidoglycan DD-metalloendopeptidase family protein [Mesobacillus subterraneus]MCM3684660.1 peptidoglycan DD-metalloendopeptidase family protein [Mesobacillus subterraneus]